MNHEELKKKEDCGNNWDGHCRGNNFAFVVKDGLVKAFAHTYNENFLVISNDDVGDFVLTSYIAVISWKNMREDECNDSKLIRIVVVKDLSGYNFVLF